MKIQDLLEKIGTLKNLDLDKNTDLENLVSKIILSENSIQFQVKDIFKDQKPVSKLLSEIKQTLNLIFISDEEMDCNVCFAHNPEIRSDYKQSFALTDLLDYMYAFASSSYFEESHEIIISTETELFWQLIKI